MTDVTVFGSVNLDRTERCDQSRVERLAAEDDRFPAPGETITVPEAPTDFDASVTRLGGKGANQAVAAARAGAASAIHGAVGPDAAEFGVSERFESEGVEPRLIERDTPTGAAYIWVTPDGENRIVVVSGANGTLSPADARERVERIAESAVVLLQNEIPTRAATALLDRLPDAGPTVIVDPAPTADADRLVTHPRVDLCTPNEREFAALRDALGRVTATGARVVRTEGADGASVFTDLSAGSSAPAEADSGDPDRTNRTPTTHVSAPAVDVVDTTGAGDAFTGYLGAALADGRSLEAAVEVAVRAGSRACEEPGAMTAPRDL